MKRALPPGWKQRFNNSAQWENWVKALASSYFHCIRSPTMLPGYLSEMDLASCTTKLCCKWCLEIRALDLSLALVGVEHSQHLHPSSKAFALTEIVWNQLCNVSIYFETASYCRGTLRKLWKALGGSRQLLRRCCCHLYHRVRGITWPSCDHHPFTGQEPLYAVPLWMQSWVKSVKCWSTV